jgi:hypothetical protein
MIREVLMAIAMHIDEILIVIGLFTIASHVWNFIKKK